MKDKSPTPEKKLAGMRDAKILFESELIKGDSARLMAARAAAIQIAMNDKKKAEVMKAIARTAPKQKTRRVAKKQKPNYNVFKKI